MTTLTLVYNQTEWRQAESFARFPNGKLLMTFESDAALDGFRHIITSRQGQCSRVGILGGNVCLAMDLSQEEAKGC